MRALHLAVIAVSCGACTQTEPGNAALGIARFTTTESGALSTIVGLDDRGREVARLELVHGPFVLGPTYEDLAGTRTDGRRLEATFRGQSFEWETIGYTDTTHMPPLPSDLSVVAELFTDDHVRTLLERWRIGWEDGPPPTTEADYDYACEYAGTNATACNGNGSSITCNIPGGRTAACNGGAEYQGVVVATGTSTSYVAMCCGSQSAGSYAAKSCQTVAGTGGSCPVGHYCSACGDGGPNKCTTCFAPISYSGVCSVSPVGASSCHYYADCMYDTGPCTSSSQCCSGYCSATGCAQGDEF